MEWHDPKLDMPFFPALEEAPVQIKSENKSRELGRDMPMILPPRFWSIMTFAAAL